MHVQEKGGSGGKKVDLCSVNGCFRQVAPLLLLAGVGWVTRLESVAGQDVIEVAPQQPESDDPLVRRYKKELRSLREREIAQQEVVEQAQEELRRQEAIQKKQQELAKKAQQKLEQIENRVNEYKKDILSLREQSNGHYQQVMDIEQQLAKVGQSDKNKDARLPQEAKLQRVQAIIYANRESIDAFDARRKELLAKINGLACEIDGRPAREAEAAVKRMQEVQAAAVQKRERIRALLVKKRSELQATMLMAAEEEESLFNGEDLTGWRPNSGTGDNWKVEDGLLVVTGGKDHLASEKEYSDFVLRFEWRARAQGYDSGLLIRSGRNVGANQINLFQGHEGAFVEPQGNVKSVPNLHKAPGEWNTWEVTCIGDRIALVVNGVKAWERTGFQPARGYLGIKAEEHRLEFRNFRIWDGTDR